MECCLSGTWLMTSPRRAWARASGWSPGKCDYDKLIDRGNTYFDVLKVDGEAQVYYVILNVIRAAVSLLFCLRRFLASCVVLQVLQSWK